MMLGLGLGITSQRNGNWWDAFREGGFAAVLVLGFQTDQYYNYGAKTLADLVGISA